MKSTLLAVCLILSFAGISQINHCVQDRYSNNPLFDSLEIEQQLFTYSIEERWPSSTIDTLKMLVYKPSSTVDPIPLRPFVLMIHGGSFIDGTKADMGYVSIEMARRGFVAGTIDYRLGWDCSPTLFTYCIGCANEAGKLKVAAYRAVQDARAALRYVINNAASLGVDTSAIFIQGESAGSITALHTAFWDQAEADAFCPTCVTELGDLDNSGLAPAAPFSIKGVVNSCGGINNLDILNNTNIPVIGFHDDLDCIVPNLNGTVINCLGCSAFFYVSGSEKIKERLDVNGVCYGLNTVVGSTSHCSYPKLALLKKASCFIKGILCGSCNSYTTTTINTISDCSAGTASTDMLPHSMVKIYPNPSEGKVQIRTHGEPFAVELVSVDGKVIRAFENIMSDQIVDFSDCTPGVYSLKIQLVSNDVITSQFILQ
jgi:hypothetical protein